MRRPVTRRFILALPASILMLAVIVMSGLAAEEVYDDRTLEIGRNLSCPVCEGQTVSASRSRVALEMMDTIESQVQAGRTDDDIYDYFRARYGDEILVEPPRQGVNLALWWIPVVVLMLGLGVLVLYFRESVALGRRRPRSASPGTDPELEQLAECLRIESAKDAQVEST